MVQAVAGDEPRKDTRSYYEIVNPDGAEGTWRDLPWLLWRAIRLAWDASRRDFLLTGGLQLVAALGAGVLLYVNKGVLGAVLHAGTGSAGFASILPWLAVLLGLTIANEVAQTVERERSHVLAELVGRRAFERILDVSTRVDLLAFEEPDFYDRLQRATATGQMRSLQLVNGLLGLVGSAGAAVSLLVALTSLQPLLLPLVAFGFVPLWIASAWNSRDLYRFMWGMTPNDRARGYLQHLLTGRDPAKEVRAFQLAPFLRRRYERLYDERIAELRALARRRTLRSLAGSLAAAALTGISVAGLAWLYTSGRMSLAATGASVFALYQLSGQLRSLHFAASSLYEATLFVRDYEAFLALEGAESPQSAAPRRFDRIAVEDVSFSYPGSALRALDGVSIEIGAGEVVALVGENGSGKTTLAKLIAGLYRPQLGRIAWDGVDVGTLDREELRSSVAVIFQDFERYLLPAADNVGLGRHERMAERDAIVAAAERAGADEFLQRLPDGYDTQLGREFWGGWDLSIGQWQRVALARAFFRDAPCVILDEPTAALDARAESQLFERLRELLRGRAVVLISHRFSSVRSADRIYVLRHGRVVEHGAHEELLAVGGLYAELFTLQAAAYS